MRRTRAIAAICTVILAMPAMPVASAGARTLYVARTKQYAIALKTEAGDHYAVQLAGTAECHFNEPHEDAGFEQFSEFAAPSLMRRAYGEWFAATSFVDSGGVLAGVWTGFRPNLAFGTYGYESSEESEHCSSGGRVPFRARRYVPLDSAEAGAQVPDQPRTYYGFQGPLEVYLAVRGDFVTGIRGDFTTTCRVGRSGTGEPHPLFRRPTVYGRLADGDLRGQKTVISQLGSGARLKELSRLSGRIDGDEVVGSYLRVRTVTRGHRRIERCVTGPLPFRAPRYVPAKRKSPKVGGAFGSFDDGS